MNVGGFTRPRPGSIMCAAQVTTDGTRPIPPRPCVRAAKPGSRFCGCHERKAARLAELAECHVSKGGVCVVCAAAADTYSMTGEDGRRVAFGLCRRHGRSLAWAIHAEQH